MRKFLIAGTAVFAALTLAACASEADQKPTATNDADEETASATTTTTEPEPVTPTPGDFKLAVVVLEKTNFGSAGSNITYQIDLTYLGQTELDPDVTYKVIYAVNGGEDGPQINTLEVQGDNYWVDEEEFISTASVNDELTAVVTEVLPA